MICCEPLAFDIFDDLPSIADAILSVLLRRHLELAIFGACTISIADVTEPKLA